MEGIRMNEIKIFEGHEVEVFELNGTVLFNPYHVGECLELNGEAVRKAMSRMNEKQVVKVKNSDVTNNHIRKLNNAGENFLTESGVYKLVFKSRKPNAEAFTDWMADEVLPEIRKTGRYNTKYNGIEDVAFMVKFVADDLRVNEASRLLMYENMCKDFDIPTGFLPKYEHNGNRQMKAASTLLKENNCGMSAIEFNSLLMEAGYLEERERPSSKGNGVRKFKALTEKGLKYGENVVSPHNQKEVQPLYYENSFMMLFSIIQG